MPVDADLSVPESTALSYCCRCAVCVPETLILLKNIGKSGTYMYGGERGILTPDDEGHLFLWAVGHLRTREGTKVPNSSGGTFGGIYELDIYLA